MNRSYKRPDDSPSFSSSLLDKVFRSIDEVDDEPVIYSTAARKGSISLNNGLEIHRSSTENKRKKKVAGTYRRNFETEVAVPKPERPNGTALRTDFNDSGFKLSIRSYEDSELRAQTVPSVIGVRNLKSIRTSTAASRPKEQLLQTQSCVSSRKVNETSHRREAGSSMMPKPEAPSPSSSNFQNAKCRAAKMYGDLKNVKQPISPGGKLTRFITSLFSKRNSTTNKYSSEKVRENEALHVPVTTCSSASSYYRSCLRNRPTASSKSTCPVNIVIDDRQQQQRRPRLVTTIKSLSQKCDSSGENCRELQLEKYNNNTNGVLNIHDKLDDDGSGSCASSDLFELEHIIGGNGNGTIHDELPVYESTQLNPPMIW